MTHAGWESRVAAAWATFDERTDEENRALVEALAAERIVTSSRDANLRISLHLYNVEEDVDRILDALARNRGLLA